MKIQVNEDAVIGLAICAAIHRNEWCPGTTYEEMKNDMDEIIELSEDYCKWALGKEVSVTEDDILESYFGS